MRIGCRIGLKYLYSSLYSSIIPISMLSLPPGGARTYGKIFPYQNHNKIIFLYCDAEKKAVKFDFDKKSHRLIPRSVTSSLWALYPYGIRIGNYFWIFGGTKMAMENLSMDYNDPYYRSETLLWSIKKDVRFSWHKQEQRLQ